MRGRYTVQNSWQQQVRRRLICTRTTHVSLCMAVENEDTSHGSKERWQHGHPVAESAPVTHQDACGINNAWPGQVILPETAEWSGPREGRRTFGHRLIVDALVLNAKKMWQVLVSSWAGSHSQFHCWFYLRAATQGDLDFPRTRTVTFGSRAFAVSGPIC